VDAMETPLETTAAQLKELLDLVDCWYEPFPFEAQFPRIEPGQIFLPPLEPGLQRWRLDTAIELPVRVDGLTVGRFVLVPRRPTTGVAFSPRYRERAIEIAEWVAPQVYESLVIT